MRRTAHALGLLWWSAALHAEVPATAPSAMPHADMVPASPDPRPEAAKSKRPASARKGMCGCARPRLLREGKTWVLDETRSLAAWVEEGSGAHLETYQKAAGELRTFAAPLVQQAYDISDAPGAVPSRTRLVRLFATAPEEDPFYIGILRPPSKAAGDVVEARIDLTSPRAQPPSPGWPSRLVAMHLGPLEVRETPSCGTYHTRRLALAVADPRDEPAALWVQFRPNQGAPRTALVDIRHARTFGLGRVDACAHGLPLSPDEAGEVEIHTVSREFVRGPVWRFRVDPATETQPLVPVEMPTEADLSQLENPFAPGYRTPIERVLSDDIDNAVLGAMVLLVVAASVAAWLFWAGRRRRKRHVAEIPCPSCEHLLSLDLGAPETDGMFCPACGKSSVFVTLEPDGTPRARVMKLAR